MILRDVLMSKSKIVYKNGIYKDINWIFVGDVCMIVSKHLCEYVDIYQSSLSAQHFTHHM